MQYYGSKNKANLLDRVWRAIPLDLRENNVVRQLITELKYDFKNKITKIELKGKKKIHIFAGSHYEKWDGNSDIREGI